MMRISRFTLLNKQGLDNIVKRLVFETQVRKYSSDNGGQSSTLPQKVKIENATGKTSVNGQILSECLKPDREISLLGPKDSRCALPGNVGLVADNGDPVKLNNILLGSDSNNCLEILEGELSVDRHSRICEQFLYENANVATTSLETIKAQNILECSATTCPELLCKDFQELFPSRSLGPNMTVVTICQKTENDMSAWNFDMESEREELMEHFIELSECICSRLAEAGYWADFIDPSSGRPYKSKTYTNATFFETDERYRHFGFTIEDLGCCKVITHHIWGRKSFVGSLFTNAPVESPDLQAVLNLLSS